MAKRLAKILTMGVVLIMCVGLFTGCGAGENVEFTVGTAWANNYDKQLTKIINSLDDIADGAVSLDGKYDNDFFADNSLIIVAFKTRSGGGEIEEIIAIRQGNKVVIEINGTKGMQTVISSQIVVLEVKKDAINGVNKIQFTTNMDKY